MNLDVTRTPTRCSLFMSLFNLKLHEGNPITPKMAQQPSVEGAVRLHMMMKGGCNDGCFVSWILVLMSDWE